MELLTKLTLIPVDFFILWALYSKIRRKEWMNVLFVFLAGFTLIANGMAVHMMIFNNKIPIWVLLVQLILSPTIVPQAYLYFCRQMGTKGDMGVHISTWSLMALLLVPSLSIDFHPFTEATMCEPLEFMHFNIFNHGKLIYCISIPSLIILIQALITCIRIPVVTKALKVYELRFSRGGRSFVTWWVLTIVFCVFSSLIEMETLRHPTWTWIYFLLYMTLVSFIFGHIALNLDLHPIQDGDEQDVANMDEYIQASHEMAERTKRLFMEEKIYLRQGIVTDDVAKMLGTNRTYFTRMMRAEFNMSFNEFVTSERIAYSKTLLTATDKTLDEIATESGYGNASAFCRVFKRLTNVTPEQWRKDHSAG